MRSPFSISVMKTRPAILDDALAISKVHVASWQAAYAGLLPTEYLASLSVESRASRWKANLLVRESTTIVAEFQGRVVGFASYGKCRDEGAPTTRAELWSLYAAPEAWSQGVGRALMLHAADELQLVGFQETSLWVLTRNSRAVRFYETWGFVKVPGSNKLFELGGIQVEEVLYLWHHDA